MVLSTLERRTRPKEQCTVNGITDIDALTWYGGATQQANSYEKG